MKIGLVLEQFDPAAGGLERWTVGFAEHVAAAGHEPLVVAFEGVGEFHRAAGARGVWRRAASLARVVGGLGADVVLDTGAGDGGDVFMPCTGSRQWSQRRLIGTHPWPMRLRAAVSPRSRGLDWRLGRLERAQVRRARRIIAVSTLVRDLLVARFGVAAERMVVIPNGVPVARFAAERLGPRRAAVRAALGVGDRVVFLGSAHNPWLKGMDTAIRALPEAAVLLVAGAVADGRWAALLEQAAGRVRFLGLVEDMAGLFAAADALVHPTRWDAGSLSTIEAGAAGLPVITSAANGAASLIEEGVSGFVLADAEDVAGLAARMRALLDPALRQRMGAAARQRAAGHDVARNYAAVLEVLRETARQKARP